MHKIMFACMRIAGRYFAIAAAKNNGAAGNAARAL